MFGIGDDTGDAVDESDHCMFPVANMIAEPQTEETLKRHRSKIRYKELEGEGELSDSRIAEIERIEIEIKGIGDSPRLLGNDDGRRRSADAVHRFTDDGRVERGVMSEDVVDGGKINVATKGG